MLDNYIIVYISTCFLYLSWYTNANVQTTSLCPLMETNSDLCPESPTTINWLDLGLFWVTIIIITIIFLSPYLSQPLSSPQPDWVKVFISATVANIVLKKLNMQFWMKSLFTLSQILKQHHWQPVPNDEMTSPYSWVIIRKIFLVWIFYIDGFTNLILAFYLSLKELWLPLSVERLESSIPRSWQMSVVFLHFCTSGFKPCLGICFLCIAYDNVVQLPGKSICSGAKSPSSPEGAFSEAPVFTLFFLLDKTVFLDLTNQSRHFYSDQMRVDTEGWLRRNLEVWSGPVLACRPPWQRWLAWQWCCPRWQRWERGQSQTSLHLSQRLQTVYIIDNWDWRRINCIEFLNWPGVALETSGGEGEMVPFCVGCLCLCLCGAVREGDITPSCPGVDWAKILLCEGESYKKKWMSPNTKGGTLWKELSLTQFLEQIFHLWLRASFLRDRHRLEETILSKKRFSAV